MKWSYLLALAYCITLPLTALDYDLIIVAGQSNAQGWKGNAAELKTDVKLDRKIPMYYVYPEGNKPGENDHKSTGWETLGPQKGRFPKGHFGPEVQLAREVKKANGLPAVFKYSKGATSLSRAWRKEGKKGLTDGMLDHLKQAIQLLKKDKHTVKISAFVWIQGESDSRQKDNKQYSINFSSMIKSLRKITKQKNFPIILGIDEQHKLVAANPVILNHHINYAKKNKNAEFVSMMDLQKADSTHLTPDGLIEHGKRLFSAYKKLNK